MNKTPSCEKNYMRFLSVAPMMDWTDRHCRVFHRILSSHTFLHTEMITANAILNGDKKRLLNFDPSERPLALQLGGSNEADLYSATRIAMDFGYDEINLNVGCPSGRVKSGGFGAILMEDPDLVARCVGSIKKAAGHSPVSVKCRLGVDFQIPEIELPIFLQKIIDAGIDSVTIHARKALLNGLSPKANRSIPKLDYDLVLKMKSVFPFTKIYLNGGVVNLEQANNLIKGGLDGVMIGRAAYNNPRETLLPADQKIFGDISRQNTMFEAIYLLLPYIEKELSQGTKLFAITKHLLSAFNGMPGAKLYRRTLCETGNEASPDPGILLKALDFVN